VESRRAGYSAEFSPRLRLGGRVAGDEPAFATGLGVPLLFGAPGGALAGPVVDLATAGFDTFEPGAGVGFELFVGGARLGAEVLGGRRWGLGKPASILAGGLRLGGAFALTDASCPSDCGVRYVASGGVGVRAAHAFGPRADTTWILYVDFDGAVLAAPFALAMADWRF
jgi:hypothetical protein